MAASPTSHTTKGKTTHKDLPQNRQSAKLTTREAVDHFNEAFDRHDAEELAALLTDDTVFEDLPCARWAAERGENERRVFRLPMWCD